jgi:hypothetical protein
MLLLTGATKAKPKFLFQGSWRHFQLALSLCCVAESQQFAFKPSSADRVKITVWAVLKLTKFKQNAQLSLVACLPRLKENSSYCVWFWLKLTTRLIFALESCLIIGHEKLKTYPRKLIILSI